ISRMRAGASPASCSARWSKMRSRSWLTLGASSIRAISAGELFRYRSSRRLACQSILEIRAHLAPGNGLARRDDFGKSTLGNRVEVAAPFFLLGLLGDG